MAIQTRREGDAAVVAVSGKLDMVTQEEFRNAVKEAIDGGAKRAVIDLGELTYVSSAGIGALAAIASDLKGRGGDLRVANLQGNVQRIFEICGIDKVVRVHRSVEEALTPPA
jgi:anti-anti-sigma factor